MKHRIILPILLGLALAACGDTKKPADAPAPATPAPADTQAAAPSEPQVLRRPGATFEDRIHEEYSYLAINIPKRVSDSILVANKTDPHKIEKMTAYLKRQDTVARLTITEKYGITLDSLNRILKQKDAER